MRQTTFCFIALIMACAQSGSAQEASPPASPGTAAIERAAAAKKFTFVFFWKDQNPQTDRAWKVLQPAATKMADWAEVAAVKVTDPAEKALVARFDVSRAPMPLILAVAPCGAVTKAFSGTFDEAQLQAAYVSPCTQLCLKALQDRKLVLLCVVEQSGPTTAAAVPQGARDFKSDETYGNATEIVMLNADDKEEAGFLQELQVDAKLPKPCTVLLAPPGSVIGQFASHASKQQIMAKLVAAQNNPCAGGKCGPNGCGPKK